MVAWIATEGMAGMSTFDAVWEMVKNPSASKEEARWWFEKGQQAGRDQCVRECEALAQKWFADERRSWGMAAGECAAQLEVAMIHLGPIMDEREGFTRHCYTVEPNSKCPYLKFGCLGCTRASGTINVIAMAGALWARPHVQAVPERRETDGEVE